MELEKIKIEIRTSEKYKINEQNLKLELNKDKVNKKAIFRTNPKKQSYLIEKRFFSKRQ